MSQYTTVQGDMWDMISYRLFGAERYMVKLIEANPDHADTVIFSAGVVLTIPTLETATTPQILPPWKRVDQA